MPYSPDDIAKVQECIVEADLRVSAQIDRIEQMIEKGHDTTEAKELLRQLESILDQWHLRQQIILDALARG